jgi:methylated-DNA-[protein]-cysteine S-methyltransferase
MQGLGGHGGGESGKPTSSKRLDGFKGGWTRSHVLYMFYRLESPSARRKRNEFLERCPVYAYALFDTAIGRCGLAWGPRGVIGAQLPERSAEATRMRLLRHCPNAEETAPPKQVARGIEDIQALMRGEKKSLRAIQLDMTRVQPFNARVYETARAIPPGTTRTYGEIARAIGEPDGARTVGQALGRNPFAIIVPCHRVVGADGKLVGFSANGGVRTKLRMLQIEGWNAEQRSLFEEMA